MCIRDRVAGGRVENTGQEWNTAGTAVTNSGGSPTLIEQVRGSITLRDLERVRAIQVQPIDGAGQPVGAPINAVEFGNEWKIPLGGTTTWYEVTIRR